MKVREMVIAGIAVLIGVAILSQPKAEDPAANAAVAADIGDTVSIRYPASTIMCADRNDASQVYVAGEMALRETMRVENSVSKAIDAEKAGQKAAMAKAYSCQWAPRDGKYVVKDKAVVGSDKDRDALYVAKYCLKPADNKDDKCWWISASANMNPQIVKSKP